MKRARTSTGKLSVWETFSHKITTWTGSPIAFAIALGVVVVWVVSGPLFEYSDTWQLVINTGTTVVTFLMVFLIQHSQNKESLAVQLKLNELIAAVQGASNHLLNVEDLTGEELKTLHRHYAELAKLADKEIKLGESHSIEETRNRHKKKHK